MYFYFYNFKLIFIYWTSSIGNRFPIWKFCFFIEHNFDIKDKFTMFTIETHNKKWCKNIICLLPFVCHHSLVCLPKPDGTLHNEWSTSMLLNKSSPRNNSHHTSKKVSTPLLLTTITYKENRRLIFTFFPIAKQLLQVVGIL